MQMIYNTFFLWLKTVYKQLSYVLKQHMQEMLAKDQLISVL